MTLQTLFTCAANDVLMHVSLYDNKYTSYNLFVDFEQMTKGNFDHDAIIFNDYRDCRVKEWYVTYDGRISIRLDTEF